MSEIKEKVGPFNIIIEYHKGVIIDYHKKNNVALETTTNAYGNIRDIKAVNKETVDAFIRTDDGKEISMPMSRWSDQFRKGSNVLWGHYHIEGKTSKKNLFIKNLDTNFSRILVNKTPPKLKPLINGVWSILYFAILGSLIGILLGWIGHEYINESIGFKTGTLTGIAFLSLFYPAFLRTMKSGVGVIDKVHERAEEIMNKYS